MSNHGKVGKSLYLKFTSERWFEQTGDNCPHGTIISMDEFNKNHGYRIAKIPIHIDNTTQGTYECVCEDGTEVY